MVYAGEEAVASVYCVGKRLPGAGTPKLSREHFVVLVSLFLLVLLRLRDRDFTAHNNKAEASGAGGGIAVRPDEINNDTTDTVARC